MSIKYLDMFSGIGGFRSGLEAVGGFECIGYCEIDQYARRAYEAMYDTKGEMYFEDATKINPDDLPDIDLITGGFPCQAFSIAGRRNGFADTRGTLFFEIARIAAVKKPALLFLENVPGLAVLLLQAAEPCMDIFLKTMNTAVGTGMHLSAFLKMNMFPIG